MNDAANKFVEEVELEDVKVKWSWSFFDGREDSFNALGNRNFTVVLPEDVALKMIDEGWSVKKYEGREEGDDPEYTLKVKISYRFEGPKVYFIKGSRKMSVGEADLSDIRRATCEQIDVVITPSRWMRPGGEAGITAYAREIYVKIRQSRFAAMYDDYEEA